MPKLPAAAAKAVDAAEAAQGFSVLPEGRYAAQLRGVVEREGKEYPYWVWEFENLHNEDGDKVPGRQWNNTSLSPKSAGFLKGTFEAFGYTSDSDTDEMIGEWVVLHVVQEPIQNSKDPSKNGTMRNAVATLSEFTADDWPFDVEAAAQGAAGQGFNKTDF